MNKHLHGAGAEQPMHDSAAAPFSSVALAKQQGEGINAPPRGWPTVLPTRRPVRHTGRNFRGKYYSSKNARHIKCESYLEVKVARLLEFLKNVVGYSEQPPALSFRVGGRRRKLTPDFVIHRRGGGDRLVEVKPAELAETPELKAKFAAAAEAALARGYRFVVLTERNVAGVASQNLEEMLAIRARARTQQLGTLESVEEPKLSVALVTAFAHGGSMPLSQLLSLLGNGPGAKAELMTLLAFRVLAWDIDQRLESGTPISLCEEIDDEFVFA